MELLFRINELTLLLYFVSLSGLSFDFYYRNRQVRKVSILLSVVAMMTQFIMLIYTWITIGRIPLLQSIEGLYFLSWLMVLAGLIHYIFRKSEVIYVFYLIPGFIGLSIFTFSSVDYASHLPVSDVMNELLFIHVLLIFLSYIIIFIACVHGFIYLIQDNNLKRKNFKRTFFSLFSLDVALRVQVRTLFIGLLAMTISIILGIQWGIRLYGIEMMLDIKVLGNLLIIIFFVINIMFFKKSKNARQFSLNNIIIFALCMLNYLLTSQLSEFHNWND